MFVLYDFATNTKVIVGKHNFN